MVNRAAGAGDIQSLAGEGYAWSEWQPSDAKALAESQKRQTSQAYTGFGAGDKSDSYTSAKQAIR